MIMIITLVAVIILNEMGIKVSEEQQITYEKCCGGSPCTDTYYEDGKCKSTFPDYNTGFIIWLPVIICIGIACLFFYLIYRWSKR